MSYLRYVSIVPSILAPAQSWGYPRVVLIVMHILNVPLLFFVLIFGKNNEKIFETLFEHA